MRATTEQSRIKTSVGFAGSQPLLTSIQIIEDTSASSPLSLNESENLAASPAVALIGSSELTRYARALVSMPLNKYGWTALHAACYFGHIKIV